MQGQKVVKKTVLTLFKTMLYLCLFIVVGFISYRVTLAFYNESNGNSSTNHTSANSIVTARTDAVALNLVFGVEEANAEIKSIVLEIFNTNTKNIDLITIPASTKVTMSQELYAELAEVNANIPQIITLSQLGQYFDQDVVYEYAILILNEFLNTDISFYSALLTKDFNSYFAQISDEYRFTASAVAAWKGYTDTEEYLDALIKYYEVVQSNLKLADRKTYIPSYLEANYDYIHTHSIQEEYVDGRYMLSSNDKLLLESIISCDSTYTSMESVASLSMSTETSSKGLNIQILNGTGISGLAADYKSRLEEEGFSISSIGNYTGATIETTQIIVNEDGLGTDLMTYFTGPEIETKIIEGGYDILIILGSKDA